MHRIFDAAIFNDVHGYGAATFFGPFTQLCFILFSIDGPYCIDPQFECEAPEGSREHINFVPTLLVEFELQHPVFFLQISHPDSFHNDSKREEADKQMRRISHQPYPFLLSTESAHLALNLCFMNTI